VALTILVMFVTVDSIGLGRTGMLWDELAVASYGESYVGFIKNLDFSQRDWSLNDEHPPFGKYIYGVARTITKHSSFLTNLDPLYSSSRALTFSRFMAVLMGGIAVASVFLMSDKFFGFRTGILSALFLACAPHFLAYTRIASLEMPLLLFGLLFVWAFMSALNRDYPDSGLSRFGIIPIAQGPWILAGVLLGAALSSRFNGFFLCLLYEAGLLLFYGKSLFTREHFWKVFLPALSLLFLYIIWPWLWPSPIINFANSVDRGLEIHTKEYFLGRYAYSPVFYYFVFFLATTPLIILALFFLPVSHVLKKTKLSKTVLLLYLYFLTPYLASFVPLKQDGIRYVQFSFPAVAVLAAFGFDILLKKAGTTMPRWFGKVVFVVVAILTISIPIRFYPYYLDYFNGLFGSLSHIVQTKTFELGWWGEGSIDAVEKINQIAKVGDTVFVDFAPGHTLPGFIDGVKSIKLWQGRPTFILVNLFAVWYGDASNTIAYAKENGYKLVYQVKIANEVPIVWVYEATK